MIILNKIQKINYKTVITVGDFDGVHVGHKKLIKKTKDIAKNIGAKSLVFTFVPNTKQILFDRALKNILTFRERRFALKKFDIDFLVECLFDSEFAKIDSNTFFDMLIENFNCVKLVVGENFKFGSDKANLLKKDYMNMIITENQIMFYDQKISSSYIRRLIADKKIEQANIFLSERYFVMSEVVHGQKRNIGFPTINFIIDKDKLLPPDGVYQTKTLIHKKIYLSVTNIGCNPTFASDSSTIETHILDYNKNIYGETAIVFFEKFLRDEIKFDSLNNLKKQIQKDIAFIKSQDTGR